MAENDALAAAASFRLSKPIKAHGEEVTELKFREPTGLDVIEVGFPLMIAAGGEVKYDAGRMAQMISRLANIPPSSVSQILPVDLQSAAWALTGFFLPAP